jgi:translation initiation factor IF-2
MVSPYRKAPKKRGAAKRPAEPRAAPKRGAMPKKAAPRAAYPNRAAPTKAAPTKATPRPAAPKRPGPTAREPRPHPIWTDWPYQAPGGHERQIDAWRHKNTARLRSGSEIGPGTSAGAFDPAAKTYGGGHERQYGDRTVAPRSGSEIGPTGPRRLNNGLAPENGEFFKGVNGLTPGARARTAAQRRRRGTTRYTI